ncbi:hypothetical protein CRG98_011071, partial [Punica granatum]
TSTEARLVEGHGSGSSSSRWGRTSKEGTARSSSSSRWSQLEQRSWSRANGWSRASRGLLIGVEEVVQEQSSRGGHEEQRRRPRVAEKATSWSHRKSVGGRKAEGEEGEQNRRGRKEEKTI